MTARDCPRSAVPYAHGAAGVIGIAVALIVIRMTAPHPLIASWLVVLSGSLPMLWLELRSATPRPVQASSAPLLWLLGFVVASAPPILVLAMAMAPARWAIGWSVAALPFLVRYLLEWRLRKTTLFSGFPQLFARALLAKDTTALKAHRHQFSLWMLKGFFVPIYGFVLFSTLTAFMVARPTDTVETLFLVLALAFTLDLTFGIAGYVFASEKLFHSVVSLQTRLIGWAACFFCYSVIPTHWPQIGEILTKEHSWPADLQGAEVLTVAPLLLLVLTLYISATVAFGLRFANLANRGIITTGPYRLMKHPAYFGHVAMAWITVLVLGEPSSPMILALVAFTAVYRLRAVTEEAHLREDPVYVEYERWVSENGLLGKVRAKLRSASNRIQAVALRS